MEYHPPSHPLVNTVFFYGCGGHSRSVLDIFRTLHPTTPVIFVDPHALPHEHILGCPSITLMRHPQAYFFCSGDNKVREQLFLDYGETGLLTLVSAKAHVGLGAQIKAGVLVGHFCLIGPLASIGYNTIINNGAIIEHEVSIGDHTHIGPNATISGRSRIGNRVFVGVGAIFKDCISVCDDVTIGAGAVVVKNIIEPGTYVGVPAKRLLS